MEYNFFTLWAKKIKFYGINRRHAVFIGVNMPDISGEYLVPVIESSNTDSVMAVAVGLVLLVSTAFALVSRFDKLGELAGLLQVPTTVPGSFSLSFYRR